MGLELTPFLFNCALRTKRLYSKDFVGNNIYSKKKILAIK